MVWFWTEYIRIRGVSPERGKQQAFFVFPCCGAHGSGTKIVRRVRFTFAFSRLSTRISSDCFAPSFRRSAIRPLHQVLDSQLTLLYHPLASQPPRVCFLHGERPTTPRSSCWTPAEPSGQHQPVCTGCSRTTSRSNRRSARQLRWRTKP